MMNFRTLLPMLLALLVGYQAITVEARRVARGRCSNRESKYKLKAYREGSARIDIEFEVETEDATQVDTWQVDITYDGGTVWSGRKEAPIRWGDAEFEVEVSNIRNRGDVSDESITAHAVNLRTGEECFASGTNPH